MSKMMQDLAVINSAIRTLLGIAFLGLAGFGGWYGYNTYYAKDLAIAEAQHELADARLQLQSAQNLVREREREIQTLRAEVERLDTAMRLLKVDHRVARLTVLDQASDGDTGMVLTRLEFQELDESGEALDAPKEFTIPGDVVYIDSWVVKFDDKYVEQADLHRSTSLVLFRRAFGEQQKPLDGAVLDEVGGRPKAYARGQEMSDFEKKIWSDFWSVANDEARQSELGIRAAHGEAPSIKVQKGKAYRVELRASAGLTITPDGDAPPRPAAPST